MTGSLRTGWHEPAALGLFLSSCKSRSSCQKKCLSFSSNASRFVRRRQAALRRVMAKRKHRRIPTMACRHPIMLTCKQSQTAYLSFACIGNTPYKSQHILITDCAMAANLYAAVDKINQPERSLRRVFHKANLAQQAYLSTVGYCI
jgi:hypothetical protein